MGTSRTHSQATHSHCAARVAVAVLLIAFSTGVRAQHVSVWGGAGVGSFLTGGPGAPNWHRLFAVDIALPGDALELRGLKGTLERSRDIPTNVGDDDLDYEGVDVVVTHHLTGLPFDVAAGAVRYEETYHLGYPNYDFGGRGYVHRWGPHLSALRWWPATRFGQLWAEADVHYAPYRPRQVVVFLDVGLGLRL
jgi:hypothetical protein